MQDTHTSYKWQDDVFNILQSLKGPFHLMVTVPRQRGGTTFAQRLRDQCNWKYIALPAHFLVADLLPTMRKRGHCDLLETGGTETYDGLVVDNVPGNACEPFRHALKNIQFIEIVFVHDATDVKFVITLSI